MGEDPTCQALKLYVALTSIFHAHCKESWKIPTQELVEIHLANIWPVSSLSHKKFSLLMFLHSSGLGELITEEITGGRIKL